MKRNLIRVVVMLAVVAVAIISAGAIIRARSAKAEKVQIKTAKAEKADVKSTVSATGVINAYKLVDVRSNVGGTILKLAVDVGDRVKKGQVIAEIDPTDTEAALAQAKARWDTDEAKLAQAKQNLLLQGKQSETQIAQARQSLLSAQARLRQAQNQNETQPLLTTASIDQAKANLEAAKQSLKQLTEATIPQTKTQAEANLSQAQSNMETARRNLERQKTLLEKGYVPQSTLDTAESQYESAKSAHQMAKQKATTVDTEYEAQRRETLARVAQAQAQLVTAQHNSVQNQIKKDELEAAKAAVEEAKSALDLAYANKRQIEVRQKDVVQALAAIVSSNAQLDQAKKNMTYVTIRAPRDGIVLQKSVEEGTVISSSRSSVGQGPMLVQLGDVSRMFVICQVDETDIGGVEVGLPVDITVDAYPSEIFDGKVTRVDPLAKVVQNVTTIPVTVEIDNPDLRLKPEMNATCEFITAKHENVLAVPNEAVHEDSGESTVQVMVGEKPVSKKVEVGISGADLTEIRSGLKEGEVVVTQIIEPQKDTAAQNQPRSPFASPFGGGGPRGGRGGGGGSSGGGGGRGR